MIAQPTKGYNSHNSSLLKLSDIYKSENEKHNSHITEAIKQFCIDENCDMKDLQATWVCHSPVDCFQNYVVDLDYTDLEPEEIKEKFPEYMDEVYEVDLSDMKLVYGDEFAGYLYAKKQEKEL